MSYFDEHNLLHIQKDIPSENGILFLAYWAKLKILNNDFNDNDYWFIDRAIRNTIYYNFKENEKWYQANPPQKGDHFSRDNMWGLYYLKSLKLDFTYELPVFNWNNRTWWHPNGWAVFLSKRSSLFLPFFFILMYPLVLTMRLHSKWTKKPGETSGTLLWWLMYGSEKDDIYEDFVIYVTNAGRFNNQDHPILAEAKKLWGHHAQNDRE